MATSYRADIDGLRAVAVALVVLFHAFPSSPSGGFIGVDVFFVISGYLITGLIIDQQAAGSFSIMSFYIRRARRILPSLVVVIAATIMIGWFVLGPTSYEKLGLHAMAGALFFPNIIYWSEARDYFNLATEPRPLLHLWSLGVEEQFYLVWPPFLIAAWFWKSRRTTILCALSAASLIYSSIAAFHDPVAAFYSPLSRLWELGTGGILASRTIKVRYPEIVSLLGVVTIVIAGSTMTSQMVFPGLLATIPVGGTAMVIVGRSRLLSWRPLVALGLISYPLYLWHWPLLSFAAILDFHTELAKALIVVASGFLAWLTTRYVEYPIRFGTLRSRGAAISLAGTLAVSLGAFLICYFSGVPQRYPEEIRPVLATKDEQYLGPARRGVCWITYEQKFKDYAPECREGETLVWGDSYSAMLATGLPKPYAQFSHDRCQPLLTGGEDQCALENAAVADEILRLKPKRVILFGRWQLLGPNWLSDPKLNDALRATLKKLRSGIADVVLVGPAPEWWPNLPDVVFRFWKRSGEIPDRITLPADYYHATDQSMSTIARQEYVRFISIFDALCDQDGCLTHTPASRSELLAYDYGHLTVPGAVYVVRRLGLDVASPPPAQ